MLSRYTTIYLFFLTGVCHWAFAGPPEARAVVHVPMRAITQGPEAHWFGYYDKDQFDETGRYVLGQAVTFEDRAPKPGDSIELGIVDLEDSDRWIPLARTSAWNWQQGAMLQWLPGHERTVIYNIRKDDAFHAVIHEIDTGHQMTLPRAIYAVSPDGETAVTLNFARLDTTRPGYGYAGGRDDTVDQLNPTHDGIYRMNLATGESDLIISLADIADIAPHETMTGKHWFNHLLFSPNGERFIFLHRWRPNAQNSGPWRTRMFTAAPDGSNIHPLIDHGVVSHFIWRDPQLVLAWSREPETGDKFHLYKDLSDEVEVIGEGVITRDGHATYSPDGEWILTDTYPDSARMQTLMLYRPRDGELIELGRFYMPEVTESQLRCDLHPRWSRDGNFICIDSMHTGQRQMYLLYVAEIMN